MARRFRGIFRRGRDPERDGRAEQQRGRDEEPAIEEPATEINPAAPVVPEVRAAADVGEPLPTSEEPDEEWAPPADAEPMTNPGPQTGEWAEPPAAAPAQAPAQAPALRPASAPALENGGALDLSEAEERFAVKLAERERQLERERVEKISAIEDSNRRLIHIEQRSLEARERIEAAEQALAEEANRLKLETASHLEEAARQARENAQAEADRRLAEKEAELESAKAAAESSAREAEQRAEAAELRARQAEEAGARIATDARVAAAEWLRGQANALRREGAEPDRPAAAPGGAKRAERGSERAGDQHTERRSREERFRAAAKRLGSVAGRTNEINAIPGPRLPVSTTARDGEKITLSSASFEQLRGLGLSVTQAKQVLRYRDERGLSSVEDLVGVPGFPRSLLDDLRSRLSD